MAAKDPQLSATVQATQPLQAVTASLQAGRKLWEASDRDAIAAEAMALLEGLVPEAVVKRCRQEPPLDAMARSVDHAREIRLSEHLSLRVSVPGGDHNDAVFRAAMAFVRTRIAAFDRQNELAESVEQLGRSERLQRALYAIADQASAADTDLSPMYKALHVIVGTLMYAENFFIALYDPEHDHVWFPYFADCIDSAPPLDAGGRLVSAAATHPVWSMTDIKHGPTWHLIRGGKPLMGPLDVIAQQVSGPFQASGGSCEDLLGAPLLSGGEIVGCVVVQSYEQANQYDERDKALLIYVAQHIQTALERRRAHAELEHRVEERTLALQEANNVLHKEVVEREHGERLQTALFRIAELASGSDSIDDFYAAVHYVVGELLDARNFFIALLSDDGTQLTFPYLMDEYAVDGGQSRRLGDGLTEYVLRRGIALLADSAAVERLCAAGSVTRQGPGLKSVSWLGVPLVSGDTTVGVLVVQSYTSEYIYTVRDQELLTFVSYHIANALERKWAAESLREANDRLEDRVRRRTHALARANRDLRTQVSERERMEKRLKFQTLHDALTGLPNRTLFLQRLEQALARYQADSDCGFAVLFMDLDRFKIINDSEGHLIGDELLVQVGNRIRACLKTGDVVARLGGDEFGVLLAGLDNASHAREIGERIINNLKTPFELGNRELFTSTSIGITLVSSHYDNPDELLRDADAAMYRAKADGRHRCEVFDDEMRQDAVTLLEVQNDLRYGLSRNEFVPYYQPIVDIKNGRIVGYEALMRWHHPQRGVLSPGQFLNTAEDMGISIAMDRQLFAQVCRDANALRGDNNAFVSINLSTDHFNTPGFDRYLIDLLHEHDVPASRLRVEVTERALLENTTVVKQTLAGLRQGGVHIALDDFGTGYSSLSYLHQYPLQTLKIDQSFVANLVKDEQKMSDAVIRAIIAMAENLSINVIAEGVETPMQRDLLQDLNCRYVQGFLYSKAQPAATWTGRKTLPFTV